MTAFLFNVPKSILSLICTEWLSLKDVCLMDSALCNYAYRSPFLIYLKCDAFSRTVNFNGDHSGNNFTFLWLQSRDIPVETIAIPPQMKEYNLIHYLHRHGDKIRAVNLQKVNHKNCDEFSRILTRMSHECVSLQKLVLTQCDLAACSRPVIKLIKSNIKLETLTLSHCVNVSQGDLTDILLHSRSLTELRITYSMFEQLPENINTNLHGRASNNNSSTMLKWLVSSNTLSSSPVQLARLEVLDLTGCVSMPSDIVQVLLLRMCSNLRALSLAGCNQLFDTAITGFDNDPKYIDEPYFRALTSLNISGCDFAKQTLVELANSCHTLTTLNVSDVNSVDDRIIHEFVKNNPRLQSVTLGGRDKDHGHSPWSHAAGSISDRSLVAIARYCTNIHALHINYCGGLTSAGLNRLLQYCGAKLQHLHICCEDLKFVERSDLDEGDTEKGGDDFGEHHHHQQHHHQQHHHQQQQQQQQQQPPHSHKLACESVVHNITENCANLTHLTLFGNDSTICSMSAVTLLTTNCAKLEVLVMKPPFSLDHYVCPFIELTNKQKHEQRQQPQWMTQSPMNTQKRLRTLHILDESFSANMVRFSRSDYYRIATQWTLLTELHIRNSAELNDSSVVTFTSYCDYLTSISISHCFYVLGDCVQTLCQRYSRQLTHLSLVYNSHNRGFASDVLNEVKACKQLRSLDISRNALLDTHTLASITHACRRLTSLNVCGCERLTDTAVICIAVYCGAKLIHIDLSGCTLLTEKSILKLAEKCMYLQSVFLNELYISIKCLQSLITHCQCLHVLRNKQHFSKTG